MNDSNPFLFTQEHGNVYFLETKINLNVLMDKFYIRFTGEDDYTQLISDLLKVCKKNQFYGLSTFHLALDSKKIYYVNLYSQQACSAQDFTYLISSFLSFVANTEYYDLLGKMRDKDCSDYYDTIETWLKPWVLNYQLHQKLDTKPKGSLQKI